MMSFQPSQPSVSDLHAHLALLRLEHALVAHGPIAADDRYMADLQEEMEEARQAYVLRAVSEIARLRSWLDGPRHG